VTTRRLLALARGRTRQGERGFSLIETVIALGVLAVIAAGVLPLGVMATTTTENQGHLMARCTEYAQDKMEQLLALAWGDSISDTRVFPAAANGGSGLAIGGTTNTAAPVAAYVDYLDINGNLLVSANGAPPADWFYERAWQVTSPRANLKQVSVRATVRAAALGGSGRMPTSTVAALKTFPF
jgi:prepilin-type N-terminal cleavage/methylation domain-containing protein